MSSGNTLCVFTSRVQMDSLAALEVSGRMALRLRPVRQPRTAHTLAAPPAPTGLMASAGDTTASLSWTSVPAASTYSVYQGTTPGGESGTAVQTGLSTPAATISGLTNGVTYYWKVSATNSSGEGAHSAEVSATPAASMASYPTAATIVTVHDTIPNLTRAPTIYSQSSGNWSSTSTWDLGRVPQAGDTVGIKTTHTVTYDVVSTAAVVGVGVAGTLTFRTDIDTKLTVQHLFVYEGGELRMGTVGSPMSASKVAEVVWSDVAINTTADPSQYGNGLLAFGWVRVCGATKTAFVRCSGEPAAAATSIALASAPTGWVAGDRLYLPDTRQLSVNTAPSSIWPFTVQDETPTLSSVSGSTVTLTASLTYAHQGARDRLNTLRYKPHLANLTRNVIFRSANPAGTRGHILFTHEARVDVRYALFLNLGRTTVDPLDNTTFDGSGNVTHVGTNQIGRYAGPHMHHLCGPNPPVDADQFTFLGNAIDQGDAFNQHKGGISIHSSSFGRVESNVVYNVAGFGLWTEIGDETKNVIDGNLIGRCVCYGGRYPDRGDGRGFADLGHEGTAFWFRGFDNYVRNNVGVSSAMGFKYFAFGNPTVNVPNAAGVCVPEDADYTPTNIAAVELLQFDDNEFYGGQMLDGGQIWTLGFQYGTTFTTFPTHENHADRNVIWHIMGHAYYGYEHIHLTLNDWVMLNDFTQGVTVQGGQAIAFYWGDYSSLTFKISGCEVAGFYWGVSLGSTQGTTCVILDTDIQAHIGVVIAVPYSTRGAGSIGADRFELTNCTVSNWDGNDHGDRPPKLILRQNTSDGATNFNWIVKRDLVVADWQGVPGDNFQVYATAQAGSAILPPTIWYDPPTNSIVQNLGSPETGKTNTYNWATYGIAFNGGVTPGTTTRTGIDGYCV